MSLLPTSYEDELRIFVHAVIKSGQALAEQIDHTKMWARDDLLHFSAEFPKYVEHEHTRTLRLDSLTLEIARGSRKQGQSRAFSLLMESIGVLRDVEL